VFEALRGAVAMMGKTKAMPQAQSLFRIGGRKERNRYNPLRIHNIQPSHYTSFFIPCTILFSLGVRQMFLKTVEYGFDAN